MRIESPITAASEESLLGIYLNDHLATMTIGVELARRAARGRQGSPAAAPLEELAAELTLDRAALLGVMSRLDVPVRQYKVIAARVAERIGRLKPNGRVLNRSPLSNLVEAEGLEVAVEANAACWRTLREHAEREPRLDAAALERLLERTGRQAETLDECRTDAVAEAFAGPPAPDSEAAVSEAPVSEETELPDSPSHDDLPLPDYDHLPKGSLASRIRPLDRAGVEQLLSYERAHAHRLPVVLILEHRLDELAEGAQPTAGSVSGVRPEAPPAGG